MRPRGACEGVARHARLTNPPASASVILSAAEGPRSRTRCSAEVLRIALLPQDDGGRDRPGSGYSAALVTREADTTEPEAEAGKTSAPTLGYSSEGWATRVARNYFWIVLKNVIGWLAIIASPILGVLLPGPGGVPLFIVGFAPGDASRQAEDHDARLPRQASADRVALVHGRHHVLQRRRHRLADVGGRALLRADRATRAVAGVRARQRRPADRHLRPGRTGDDGHDLAGPEVAQLHPAPLGPAAATVLASHTSQVGRRPLADPQASHRRTDADDRRRDHRPRRPPTPADRADHQAARPVAHATGHRHADDRDALLRGRAGRQGMGCRGRSAGRTRSAADRARHGNVCRGPAGFSEWLRGDRCWPASATSYRPRRRRGSGRWGTSPATCRDAPSSSFGWNWHAPTARADHKRTPPGEPRAAWPSSPRCWSA